MMLASSIIKDICSTPVSYGAKIVGIMLASGFSREDIMDSLQIKKSQYYKLVAESKSPQKVDSLQKVELSPQKVESSLQKVESSLQNVESLRDVNSSSDEDVPPKGSVWDLLINGGDVKLPI